MSTTTSTIEHLQATITKKYSSRYNIVREEEEDATVLLIHPHGTRVFKSGKIKPKKLRTVLL